ncbi:MAG: hypothetical protein QXP22_01330 [Candidatus Anstonellales archaeon]
MGNKNFMYGIKHGIKHCPNIFLIALLIIILTNISFSLNFISTIEKKGNEIEITFYPYKIQELPYQSNPRQTTIQILPYNQADIESFTYYVEIINASGSVISSFSDSQLKTSMKRGTINFNNANIQGVIFTIPSPALNQECAIVKLSIAGIIEENNARNSFDEKRQEVICEKSYPLAFRQGLSDLLTAINSNAGVCYSILFIFVFAAAAYYARFGSTIISLYDVVSPKVFKLKEPIYSLMSVSPRGEIAKKLEEADRKVRAALYKDYEEKLKQAGINEGKQLSSSVFEKHLLTDKKYKEIIEEIKKNIDTGEKIIERSNFSKEEKKLLRTYLILLMLEQIKSPFAPASGVARPEAKRVAAVLRPFKYVGKIKEVKYIGKPLNWLALPLVLTSKQIASSAYTISKAPRAVIEYFGLGEAARQARKAIIEKEIEPKGEKEKRMRNIIELLAGPEKKHNIIDIAVFNKMPSEIEDHLRRGLAVQAIEIALDKNRELKTAFREMQEELANFKSSKDITNKINSIIERFGSDKDRENLKLIIEIIKAENSYGMLELFNKFLDKNNIDDQIKGKINDIIKLKDKGITNIELNILFSDFISRDLHDFSVRQRLIGPYGDESRDKNKKTKDALFYLFLNHLYNEFIFLFDKQQLSNLDEGAFILCAKIAARMASYEAIKAIYGHAEKAEIIANFYSALKGKLEKGDKEQKALAALIDIEIIKRRAEQAEEHYKNIVDYADRIKERLNIDIKGKLYDYIFSHEKEFSIPDEMARPAYIGFRPQKITNEDIEFINKASINMLPVYLTEKYYKFNISLLNEITNSLRGAISEVGVFKERFSSNVLSLTLQTLLEERSDRLLGSGIDELRMKKDLLLGYIIYISERYDIRDNEGIYKKLEEISKNGISETELEIASKRGFLIGKTKDNEVILIPTASVMNKVLISEKEKNSFLGFSDNTKERIMSKLERIKENPLLFLERLSTFYITISGIEEYYILTNDGGVPKLNSLKPSEAYIDSETKERIENVLKALEQKLGQKMQLTDLFNADVNKFNDYIKQLQKNGLSELDIFKLAYSYYKHKKEINERIYLGDIDVFRNPQDYNLIIGTKEEIKQKLIQLKQLSPLFEALSPGAENIESIKATKFKFKNAMQELFEGFINTPLSIYQALHPFEGIEYMPYINAMNFYRVEEIKELAKRTGDIDKENFKEAIKLYEEHFNSMGFFLDRSANNVVASYLDDEHTKYAIAKHYRGSIFVPAGFLTGKEGVININKSMYIDAPLLGLYSPIFSIATRLAEPKIKLLALVNQALYRPRYYNTGYDISHDYDENLREYLEKKYNMREQEIKFLGHIRNVSGNYFNYTAETTAIRHAAALRHAISLGAGYSVPLATALFGAMFGPVGLMLTESARLMTSSFYGTKYSYLDKFLMRLNKDELNSYITLNDLYYRAALHQEQLQWYKRGIASAYGPIGAVLGYGYYSYMTGQLRPEPALIRSYARWMQRYENKPFDINAYQIALNLGNYRLADTDMLEAAEKTAAIKEWGKLEWNKLAYTFIFPSLIVNFAIENMAHYGKGLYKEGKARGLKAAGKKVAKDISAVSATTLLLYLSPAAAVVVPSYILKHSLASIRAICPNCKRERQKNVECPYCGYVGFV